MSEENYGQNSSEGNHRKNISEVLAGESQWLGKWAYMIEVLFNPTPVLIVVHHLLCLLADVFVCVVYLHDLLNHHVCVAMFLLVLRVLLDFCSCCFVDAIAQQFVHLLFQGISTLIPTFISISFIGFCFVLRHPIWFIFFRKLIVIQNGKMWSISSPSMSIVNLIRSMNIFCSRCVNRDIYLFAPYAAPFPISPTPPYSVSTACLQMKLASTPCNPKPLCCCILEPIQWCPSLRFCFSSSSPRSHCCLQVSETPRHWVSFPFWHWSWICALSLHALHSSYCFCGQLLRSFNLCGLSISTIWFRWFLQTLTLWPIIHHLPLWEKSSCIFLPWTPSLGARTYGSVIDMDVALLTIFINPYNISFGPLAFLSYASSSAIGSSSSHSVLAFLFTIQSVHVLRSDLSFTSSPTSWFHQEKQSGILENLWSFDVQTNETRRCDIAYISNINDNNWRDDGRREERFSLQVRVSQALKNCMWKELTTIWSWNETTTNCQKMTPRWKYGWRNCWIDQFDRSKFQID